MIHVDRQRTQAPKFYYGKEWEQFKLEAEAFYRLPEKERAQSRHSFLNPDEIPEIKEALIEAFYGKCAYTETKLKYDDCVIIRHRPRMGAIGLGNEATSRDHYWWLAYEWENLIPVLPECARAKGHYFPVDGERAEAGTTIPQINTIEKALLPDPSFLSEFDFEFDSKALAIPKRESDRPLIEILGLNTERAVEGRLDALDALNSFKPEHWMIPDVDQLFLNLRSDEAYLEFKIQWLEKELLEHFVSIPEDVASLTIESIKNAIPIDDRYYPTKRLGTAIDKIRSQLFKVTPDLSISSTVPLQPVQTSEPTSSQLIQSITIKRIEIKNFKGIDLMNLNLIQEKKDTPSGLMILGENGSGKSSILQAVALALEEPEKLKDHPHLTAKKVLRRGTESGHVKLYLEDHKAPIEVSFYSEDTNFHFTGPRDQVSFFLRAYGPHRILPHPSNKGILPQKKEAITNKNLWDPYEALVDAEEWIMSLNDDFFDAFALALKDLLNLKEDGFISRDSGQLSFDIGEKELTLEDLSAGYKSIIATAADIIAGYPIAGTDMKTATGIVMIDEIGAHLHPSWRMRIVSAYRNTFSNIQFICTTHEPLCLRGVRQEEIVVLQREGRQIKKMEQLPDIEQMRIDQILTSPIFGMNTTVDPKVEDQFNEYYRLLALKKPSKQEKADANELKNILYRYGVLGTDRRSRAIYDIIDKELANRPRTKASAPISPKTRKRVLELWDNSALEFDR